MSKSCIYLVNNKHLYMKMAMVSISGLRKFSNLPVKVFFLKTESESEDDFIRFCNNHNVNVVRKEWFDYRSEELSYFLINKAHLKDVEDDEVLFIDTDTFIFGKVDEIFDRYGEYDVVACENKWVDQGWKDSYLRMKPMNSGVMYWKGDWLRTASEIMPTICEGLKNKQYPLSEYLYSIDEQCWHREEFSYSIFIDRQRDIRYNYFDRQHVHNLLWESEIEAAQQSIILHSYTSQWKRVYNYVYGPTRKKISKKLLTRKHKTPYYDRPF